MSMLPVYRVTRWSSVRGDFGVFRISPGANPRPRAAILRGMEKVRLADKFAQIQAFWTPKIVGELNGQHVKLARITGSFDWHHHDEEDELFLVVEGSMRMDFRDRSVELGPGEMLIVPRGVEHRPVAEDEARTLLFEPASTRNTGNLINERTVEPERI